MDRYKFLYLPNVKGGRAYNGTSPFWDIQRA